MKSRHLLITLGLLTLPALAFAQNGAATVGAQVTVTGPAASTTVSAKANANFETKAKAKGDQEIDRRTVSLNDLLARIDQMKKLNDTDKTNLKAIVSSEISTLAALKTKVDADAVLADVKSDVQSITKSYRVYALLVPQIRVVAAADRGVTIAQDMATLEGKLSMRIGSSTGDTAPLIAADTDLKAKVVDANAQASAAVGIVAALKPDNGDAALMATNRTALKDAQAKIKVAQKDLVAARKDIETILKGLKAGATVTASTTTTTP